jgi:hypothetical protein
VGAARQFSMTTATPLATDRNNGISAAQRDSRFDQGIP